MCCKYYPTWLILFFILFWIILLVDQTRIMLPPLPGVDGSDYINGNYIKVSNADQGNSPTSIACSSALASLFLSYSIVTESCLSLRVWIVVFCNSCWFMSSGALRFRVVPVSCNRMVWQSSDMTYPAVNDPNITSGFTFNKRSVSLASELRSFVVLRPSPEQSAPSVARYSIIIIITMTTTSITTTATTTTTTTPPPLPPS